MLELIDFRNFFILKVLVELGWRVAVGVVHKNVVGLVGFQVFDRDESETLVALFRKFGKIHRWLFIVTKLGVDDDVVVDSLFRFTV